MGWDMAGGWDGVCHFLMRFLPYLAGGGMWAVGGVRVRVRAG